MTLATNDPYGLYLTQLAFILIELLYGYFPQHFRWDLRQLSSHPEAVGDEFFGVFQKGTEQEIRLIELEEAEYGAIAKVPENIRRERRLCNPVKRGYLK